MSGAALPRMPGFASAAPLQAMSSGVIRIRGARQHNLKNLDLDIHTGEMTVVTGPSGSGKSTLMKLLVGLYRPQEGKIFYNNLDETEIRFDDLRNQIGFVTQDTNLFSGTIKENLLLLAQLPIMIP